MRLFVHRIQGTSGARPGSTPMNAPTADNYEIIDDTVEASFPASDPPSWTSMHLGPPCSGCDAPRVADEVRTHPRGHSGRLGGAIRWLRGVFANH
jgi:hypothetical protein